MGGVSVVAIAGLLGGASALPSLQGRATYSIKQSVANTWSYAGCYVDSATRVLASKAVTNTMTLESCASMCAGSSYFGLEYGREVWAKFQQGFRGLIADSCSVIADQLSQARKPRMRIARLWLVWVTELKRVVRGGDFKYTRRLPVQRRAPLLELWQTLCKAVVPTIIPNLGFLMVDRRVRLV